MGSRTLKILMLFLALLSVVDSFSASADKKIHVGLYVRMLQAKALNDANERNNSDWLTQHFSEVLLFDGRVFRSSGGQETMSTKSMAPYQEISFCDATQNTLCNNQKYLTYDDKVKFPVEMVGQDGQWFDTSLYLVDEGRVAHERPAIRWLRVSDNAVAADYIRKSGLLGLFPRKKLSDFGYHNLASARVYKISGSNVNLRSEPSTEGKPIAILTRNQAVTLIETTDQIEKIAGKTAAWVKVKTEDGKIGYVFGTFVTESE